MVDKKIELEEGDQVELRGPPDGNPLIQHFTYVDTPKEDGKPSKHVIRVKGPDNKIFRVHRSRISKILKGKGQTDQSQTKETQTEEGIKMSDKAEKVEKKVEKAEKKSKAQAQAQPKPKPKKEKEQFDLPAWIASHGGVHMQKDKVAFDHTTHKVISHICIDKENGFYHTINTYRQPNAVVTAAGGNKYALKGKAVTVNVNTVNGEKQKRVNKGDETFEELIERKTKDGYKLVTVTVKKETTVTA